MKSKHEMIEFEGVAIEGGDGLGILRDVTFSVGLGEKVLIYGESGSGKSTLLLSILGKYRRSSGRILIKGTELDSRNAGHLRKFFAFIPQEPVLGTDTVRAALLLPFSFKANRHALPSEHQLIKVLEMVRLNEGYLQKECFRLSGGEKQRLVLARALLMKREVLLIDEPASALDERNEENILDILLGLDTTLMVISHNSAWIPRFEKCIHVKCGRAGMIPLKKKEQGVSDNAKENG